MLGTLERQQHNDTTTGTEQTDVNTTGNGITPEMYELLFGGADETADNGETATAHDDVMSYQVDADELDVNENEATQDADVPLSFADKHPDWEFGDGGIKDNPYTTSLIKKYYMEYYGVEPTDEQVEQLVHVATNEAQYGNALDYGGTDWDAYKLMCQDFTQDSHLFMEAAEMTNENNTGNTTGEYSGIAPFSPLGYGEENTGVSSSNTNGNQSQSNSSSNNTNNQAQFGDTPNITGGGASIPDLLNYPDIPLLQIIGVSNPIYDVQDNVNDLDPAGVFYGDSNNSYLNPQTALDHIHNLDNAKIMSLINNLDCVLIFL